MTKNEKRLLKNGILIPLLISVILAVVYVVISSSFVLDDSTKTQVSYIEQDSIGEITEFEGSPVADVISKSLIKGLDGEKTIGANTIIGKVEIGDESFDLIYRASAFAALDRFNINVGSTLPGEVGCCTAEIYKNNSSKIKLLAKGDTITINTFYSSYEYTVSDTYTVSNMRELENVGSGLGRALVLYTDNSVGAGIGDEYFVCTAVMKNGAKIVA